MNNNDILKCQKPSRYIGNELNQVVKDHNKIRLKIALCFPDLYEIGMSHTGIKILYKIINDRKDSLAERVFMPDVDMEELLRSKKIPLCTLETDTPVIDFDVLAFSVLYELCYTNILTVLDLSNIPIYSDKRNDSHPIIIAGGPAATNPLPLSPFIDAFCIGDGETLMPEILQRMNDKKQSDSNRADILAELSKIEGVFVPSLHDTKKCVVKKNICFDLENAVFPTDVIVPYRETVHDRISIEIARGCVAGCRFCQAGYLYRPYRERSAAKIIDLTENSISKTGYVDVSLLALNCSSHTEFESIVRRMSNLAMNHISVSLPSQRIDNFNPSFAEDIAEERKTGFTFAPETGGERLRNVINKNIKDVQILEVIDKVFSLGWSRIKLYFMIGLPTETKEDLEGIVKMSNEALRRGKKYHGNNAGVNITISIFSPKAHTPFQWFCQDTIPVLEDKINYLSKSLRHRGLNVHYGSPYETEIESLLSRGDHRVSRWIYEAWRAGDRLTAWSEHFNFERWHRVGTDLGLSFDEFLRITTNTNRSLPWEFIDILVSREYFVKEWEKAQAAEKTVNCQEEHCTGCGLDPKKCHNHLSKDLPAINLKLRDDNIPRQRIRICYEKTDPLLALSHLEISRVFLRAIGRAVLPVRYSEGFHPMPDVQFAFGLPVGYGSFAEYMDIILVSPKPPEYVKQILNKELPSGIKIIKASSIFLRTPSLSSIINYMEYELIYKIDKKNGILMKQQIEMNLGDTDFRIEVNTKKGKHFNVTLSDYIENLDVHINGTGTISVEMDLKMQKTKNLKPHEIVDYLAEDSMKYAEASIFMRKDMFILQNGRIISPLLYPSIRYHKGVELYAD